MATPEKRLFLIPSRKRHENRNVAFLATYLILVLLLISTPVASETMQVSNINAEQAHELLQNRPEIFLLDVRTLNEYAKWRLEKAHHIPINEVLQRIGEVPQGPVLVYAAVGSRSAQVARYLSRHGYPGAGSRGHLKTSVPFKCPF